MRSSLKKGITAIAMLSLLAAVACSKAQDENQDVTVEEAAAVQLDAVPANNDSGEGWTCTNCGATGVTGAFCYNCGVKVPEEFLHSGSSNEESTDATGAEVTSEEGFTPTAELIPYETFEDYNDQGETMIKFGTESPVIVVDPESGIELGMRANGMCCYDLGDTEVSEEEIQVALMESIENRIVNSIEALGFSGFSGGYYTELGKAVASDLRVKYGLHNVVVNFNGITPTDESKEQYEEWQREHLQ